MKVTIEIPDVILKKASFILMAQVDKEEDMKVIEDTIRAAKDEEITIPGDIFDDQAEQVYLTLCVAALAEKLKEMGK